ncbi:hypothetical protein LUZ61_008895 [Rhynchospora tenuis]|uniref:Pentatricopeptide repeat-containing protein n=1 Tax=Rhynchospora tenuis TaxID=198213 RepID=A0AAD6EY18_9POAL|nr:hypothetical protein LUZ61_008895 [Rhynchospora tenuis]
MAELTIQLRLRIFLPDQTTPSPSSSRTIVVARMYRNQRNDDKSIVLRRPGKKEHHLSKKRDSGLDRNRSNDDKSIVLRRTGKKEHHLWKKRDPVQTLHKASNLVRLVLKLPNEKEVIYSALDKWTAFEAEFPVIAIAKSLDILRRSSHWLRIIQVCKWLFSKGQIVTWSTYDTLLVAFNMEGRLDEAELVYNKVIEENTRSTPKRLFSRMISMYDHHRLPHKILEVFADMEEFGIHPDGDTTWRIARALVKSKQPEKVKQVLEKYLTKWKYLYFDGKRVRVKRGGPSDPYADQPKIDQTQN